MTATGERFAKIPEAMIKDHDLGHAAFRVYAALFCRANWDQTWTHIGEDAIAEDLDLCRSTIATQINALVTKGYLGVRRRQGCRNEYRIILNPSSGSTTSMEGPVESLDTTRRTSRQGLSNHSTLPVESLDTVPDVLPELFPDSFPEGAPSAPAAEAHAAGKLETKAAKGLASIFDAFQARDLPRPFVVGKHAKAAKELLGHYTADQIADCWVAIAGRHYGNDWTFEHLTFWDFQQADTVGVWLRAQQATANGGSRDTIHHRGNAANHPAQGGRSPAALASGRGHDEFAAYGNPDRFGPVPELSDLLRLRSGQPAESGPLGPELRSAGGLSGLQRDERAEVTAGV